MRSVFLPAFLAMLIFGCAAPSPPPSGNFSFPLFQSASLSEGETLLLGDLFLRVVRINATPVLSPGGVCGARGGSVLLQATAFGLGPSDITLVEGQTVSFGNASITLHSVLLNASPERAGNCSFSAESASLNVTSPFPRSASLGEGEALALDGDSAKVLSVRKTIGVAAPALTKVTLAKGSSYSVSNGSYRLFFPPQNITHALAVALSKAVLYEGDSVSVGGESIKVTGFDITLTTPLYPSWSCSVIDEGVILSVRSASGSTEVSLREKEYYVSPEGAFIYVSRISESVNPDQRGCTTAGERVELTYSSTSPCSHAGERANLEVTPFGRMTSAYLVERGQRIELGASHSLRISGINQTFLLDYSTGACISSPESISLEVTAPAPSCPVEEKSVLVQLSSPLLTRAQVLTEGQSFSVGEISAAVKNITIETTPPLYGACTVANASVLLELSVPGSRALELSKGSSSTVSSDFSIDFVSADASASLQNGVCLVANASALLRTNLSGSVREERLVEGEAIPLAEGTSLRLTALNYSASPPQPVCIVRGKKAFLDISYS